MHARGVVNAIVAITLIKSGIISMFFHRNYLMATEYVCCLEPVKNLEKSLKASSGRKA